MAQKLLKAKPRKVAPEKEPVEGTKKVVLVGTYKGKQLDRWPGYYNYPLGEDDDFSYNEYKAVGLRVPRDRTGRAVAPRPPVPVLADLGLVKDIATSDVRHMTSDITQGGVGTPGYGAPEQMERGEASVASDIHALGVLADRCFGGKPPRAWRRIIERATSSIPDRRYQSVDDFLKVIRRRNLWRIVGKAVLAFFLVGLLVDILIVVMVIWLW